MPTTREPFFADQRPFKAVRQEEEEDVARDLQFTSSFAKMPITASLNAPGFSCWNCAADGPGLFWRCLFSGVVDDSAICGFCFDFDCELFFDTFSLYENVFAFAFAVAVVVALDEGLHDAGGPALLLARILIRR